MTTSLALPAIDEVAIRTFCDVLFGYLEGYVPVRFLPEKGTDGKGTLTPFPAPSAAANTMIDETLRAAGRHLGTFVVPGTVNQTKKAGKEDVVSTAVILVDIDSDDVAAKRDHLARYLGDPTFEIGSGGTTETGQQKLHLYWRLTEAASGMDLERVAGARSQLAAKVGADGSFARLHQPIRVPGTIHGKFGVFAPVKLLVHRPLEYDLDELIEAVEAMPRLAVVAASGNGFTIEQKRLSIDQLAMTPVRSEGKDIVTRFDAISGMIGHWIWNVRTRRCTLDDAWTAVQGYNAAMIVPPWDESRLRVSFDRLLERDQEKNGPLPIPAPATTTANQTVPPRSEDDIARHFVEASGRSWRYVPAWSTWHVWTGTHWKADETQAVREEIRRACRAVIDAKVSEAEARRIASDRTYRGVERIAGSDPAISTKPSAWDSHPMLLNTPEGIVDLRTGEYLPHDPGLLLTQIAGASPRGSAPRWRRFLDEVTGGDTELQEYFARLFGYCLTGSTAEQVFAFLHGAGANGKSVILRTIAAVMGDYAATAPLDAFTASRNERHTSELAGLRAARLVTVTETEPDKTWAEGRIKAVTGGDTIRVRELYQKHFEYQPQFKLVIAGNHRPILKTVCEAMRRRIHLVPFSVTIPQEQRDPNLPDALLAERDGILAWMVDGCAEWQRHGLRPPASIIDAASAYIDSEDQTGTWLAECCQLGPDLKSTSQALFASWRSWADDAGIPPGSLRSLGEALKERGHQPFRTPSQRGWRGLTVLRGFPRDVGGRE